MRIPLIVFCFVCSLSPALANDIYRWVDEQGHVHFSDHAPAGRPMTALKLAEPNLIEPAKNIVRPDKPKRKKPRRANTNPAQAARDKRTRAEKCHKAEQSLKQIRARKRAGYTAEQGRDLKRRADRYTADRRFYCG